MAKGELVPLEVEYLDAVKLGIHQLDGEIVTVGEKQYQRRVKIVNKPRIGITREALDGLRKEERQRQREG